MYDNRLSFRTRNRLGLAAAAMGLMVSVSACSASATSSSSTSSTTLVIGVSLSLTGDFADPGKAVQRGYQVWADGVNAKGGILGRKVEMKIVDDLSSPNQVVTNYQNLISRDHVDLVFGPFSSLLTVPASQVANRYHYAFVESAGGGPKVFAQNLHSLFFVQPAPVVEQGNVFADYILSLPAGQRPKTAAYPSLDDPFAKPIADGVQKRFEAAGIKTVYSGTYPAETPDLTPIMAKIAAAKPDVIVSGTQSQDAYQQVKSLVQLHFNPRWLFMSNGANSPTEFPDKVGKGNTAGVFSAGDWFADSKAAGSADFVKAYIAKFGGTAAGIDNSSAEAYAAGQVIELIAKRTGRVDNQTIINSLHSGTWPTLLGDLSWNSVGAPQGSYQLVQWIGGALKPVFPASVAQAAAVVPKPNWAG
ncbi:MAG: amino acid/amide transporter substrate-binding protein family [Frankiales bacterium]|nr:amino acid/amide transporter substrate-binding protein family [Frankiales bacterium]